MAGKGGDGGGVAGGGTTTTTATDSIATPREAERVVADALPSDATI